MTFRERVRNIANPIIQGEDFRIMEGDVEKGALEFVELRLNEISSKIGYNGLTWDRPADEYPDVFYIVLKSPIYSAVVEYLETNYPNVWFLEYYKFSL